MIIDIPLFSVHPKKRMKLKFIDINKEDYNVLLVIEQKKGEGWEQGEVQILGHAKKLDMKRLGKAS